MSQQVKAQLIDEKGLQRTITRLAHEIVEHNRGVQDLVLLGIRTRGVPIAERIQHKIDEIEGMLLPLGILDVTMYRDDVFKKIKQPRVHTTEIDFEIDGKTVVLIDDVLYTGRTVRAALDAVIDFGRPKAIQLAVLIDRGHRELPIRADYVGKNVPTSFGEEVQVRLKEIDDVDGVFLLTSEET